MADINKTYTSNTLYNDSTGVIAFAEQLKQELINWANYHHVTEELGPDNRPDTQNALNNLFLSVYERFLTFLNDADATEEAINTWKEIENFLADYTDEKTLAEIVAELNANIESRLTVPLESTTGSSTTSTMTQKAITETIDASKTFTTGERVDNVGIDSEPTASSDNLVKSGGVKIELSKIISTELIRNTYQTVAGSQFTKDIYVDFPQGFTFDVGFEEAPTLINVYLYYGSTDAERYQINCPIGSTSRHTCESRIIKIRLNRGASGITVSDDVIFHLSSVGSVSTDITELQSDVSGLETNIKFKNTKTPKDYNINDTSLNDFSGILTGFSIKDIIDKVKGIPPAQSGLGYIGGDGLLQHIEEGYEHYYLPIAPSDVIKIKSRNSANAAYVLLKNYNNGYSSTDFCDGYRGRQTVSAGGTEVTVIAPNDVKYIVITKMYDNNINYSPYSIFINDVDITVGSESLPTKIENLSVRVSNLEYPSCMYSKTGNTFMIYVQDSFCKNKYYGINITLENTTNLVDDDIRYVNYWRIVGGTNTGVFEYNGSVMTKTIARLLNAGESEFVLHLVDTVDFTGGFHGDERIDKDNNCYVKFYSNGVLVSNIENDIPLTACNNFHYTEKSTLHQTAVIGDYKTTIPTSSGTGNITINNNNYYIDSQDTGLKAYTSDGIATEVPQTVSVSDDNGYWKLVNVVLIDEEHTPIAYHIKKTTFENSGYRTENIVTPIGNNLSTTILYGGICCLGKLASTIGHNDDYEDVSFTGSNETKLYLVGGRLFEAYNEINQISASIESKVINDGDITNAKDSNARMSVWDRPIDSKYYRSNNNVEIPINKKYQVVTKIKWGTKISTTN